MSQPPSQNDLAAALGLSTRRIRQLISSDGMPSHSIEAALAWRKAETSNDSAEQLRRERIKLVQSQRERIDMENRLRSGELVESARVHQDILAMVSQAKGEFLKMANDLPPRLAGLDEPRIFKIIREEMIGVLTRLSDESTTAFPPVEK